MDIYHKLEKLKGKQPQPTERMQAKYIYQDEQTEQIKEIPLDSAASASINKSNPAKSISKFMFGF